MGGHLNVLQWLRSQDPPCPWDKYACSGAAERGHLNVLQWLRSQSPPCVWDEDACSGAAKGGHLNVLQWLRSQDPPCPWDIYIAKQHCFDAGPDLGVGISEMRIWVAAAEEHEANRLQT